MPPGRWVLAVSGGRDSMVLLDAMTRVRAGEVAAVATFDHGTGAAAGRAADLVVETAERLGLPVVRDGLAPGAARGEAAWRHARWTFLSGRARELQATVVTAHTADDQIETVVQRILRDAGVRGLAGMSASGPGPMGTPVIRPLLGVSRATVGAYAGHRAIAIVEDPSNADRAHQRNRVRLDLLPALERSHPGFGSWCLDLAARAGRWRAEVERCVDALGAGVTGAIGTRGDGPEASVVVRAEAVQDLGVREWEVLWPAVAGRLGVALDRRGLERAAAWAPRSTAGSRIPLAGDACIERTASTFVVRRAARAPTGNAGG